MKPININANRPEPIPIIRGELDANATILTDDHLLKKKPHPKNIF